MLEWLLTFYQIYYMKADKNNTTALILAGGLGRRMNHSDKGLIVWENKTLISHVIDAIKNQLGKLHQEVTGYSQEKYSETCWEFVNKRLKVA